MSTNGPHISVSSSRPSGAHIDDQRVIEGLELFLELAAADRRPQIDQFVAQYPDIADRLRDCLAGLALVQQAAPDVERSAAYLTPAIVGIPTADGTLGDYRIVREVGRGGMGVVYQAEQISLARHVALKILPFAAVLDPRHLQRFKNEALAAAHLDHPNIVEVYGIGCERGIHFYAMRFVDGVTLAELLEAQRGDRETLPRSQQPGTGRSEEQHDSSSPNSAAESGCAATELLSPSLESSWPPHSSLSVETSPVLQAALSTIHAVSPMERFRRIAEIGIQAAEALDHAHQMGVVHRDIKPSNLMLDERRKLWVTDFGLARSTSDAGITKTGDLLGTLRYMSPEQALAKRVTIDHRTDIYSLGATLYELLTLRAAFPSSDREETLRQIAFDEPILPRKIYKEIPEELETIILKSMEKNADDRYATAQELADDLRRWMGHMPIVAKAPGMVLKIKKWARRHAAVVWTSTIALGAIVLLLAMGLLVLGRAYQGKIAEKSRADGNVLLAVDSMDGLYEQVIEERLFRQQFVTDSDRRLMKAILDYYTKFADRNRSYPDVNAYLANAYRRIGDTQFTLGDQGEALAAYQTCITSLCGSNDEWPRELRSCSVLCDCLISLKALQLETGDSTGAAETFRRMQGLAEHLEQNFQTDATAQLCTAKIMRHRADILLENDQHAAAEQTLRRAIGIFAALHESDPAQVAYVTNQAAAAAQLSGFVNALEAAATAREAVRLQQSIATAASNHAARHTLASYYSLLAGRLETIGQIDESVLNRHRSVDLLRQIVSEAPIVPQYRMSLASAQLDLAWILQPTDASSAWQLISETKKHALQICEQLPTQPEAHSFLGSVLISEASWHGREKDHVKFEQALRAAVETHLYALRLANNDESYTNQLFTASTSLSLAMRRAGARYEDWIATGDWLQAELPEYTRKCQVLTELYDHAKVSLSSNSELSEDSRRADLAEIVKRLNRAVTEWETRAAGDSGALNHLAWFLSQSGDASRGVIICRRSLELHEKDASVWNTLGCCLWKTGDYQGALDALTRCKVMGYDGMHVKACNLYCRAIAHEKLGQHDEAVRVFRDAVAYEASTNRFYSATQCREEASRLLQLDSMTGESIIDSPAE